MEFSRQRLRQAERQLKKIDEEILLHLERQIFLKGIRAAITETEKVMRKEFGFGDKRLKRLEQAIIKELEGEKWKG